MEAQILSLFLHYRLYLLKIANNIIQDRDEAEDIVQDIFIKVWENRDRIRLAAEFKGYLAKLVVNHSTDKLGRKRTRERHARYGIEETSEIALKEEPPLISARRIIEYANGKRTQEILTMIFIDDIERKEVARILGIKKQTVDNAVFVAMKTLKQKLKYENCAL